MGPEKDAARAQLLRALFDKTFGAWLAGREGPTDVRGVVRLRVLRACDSVRDAAALAATCRGFCRTYTSPDFRSHMEAHTCLWRRTSGAGGGNLPPADKLRAENFPEDIFTDDAEALENHFTTLMGCAPGGVSTAAAGGGGEVDLRDSDGSGEGRADMSGASDESHYLGFADLLVGMRVKSKVGMVYHSAVVKHVDEHCPDEKFDDMLEPGALQPPACMSVGVSVCCVDSI
jgi:hypothetical protein